MPLIAGCHFPDDLLYSIPHQVWYAPQPDGSVRCGLTSAAVAMSGEVLAFTPKRVGRPLEANRSCATIESGKWVGAVRIAFDGLVLAVNEPLIDRPRILSQDPYGAGWMLLARPDDPAVLASLTPGAEIGPAQLAWMAAENFPGCR